MDQQEEHELDLLLAAAFPVADPAPLRAALMSFGAAPHERESARVRRAIIVLAAGDPARVAHFLDIARVDYRDVLAWVSAPPPDAATGAAERAAALALIERWGRR